MRSDTVQLRLRIISGCFVFVALLLILRLYFVQVVHGAEYREDAMGQYTSPKAEIGARGSIFFTSKDGTEVAAAIMQSGWRMAINPKLITKPEIIFNLLRQIVPLNKERFIASAHKKNDPYEEIAFRISDADAIKIRAMKLPGVILAQDQWRLYPADELASHAIGFVGYKGDTKTGVYGLEKQYNSTLAKQLSGTEMNPFAEIFANAQAIISSDPKAYEGNIVTSIEPSVERQLEDTLDIVMKTYTPNLAGGIIMDPHSGKIIAMGIRPAYDPNIYNQVSDSAVFTNSLVEGRYEMGSIMKPLTMAAAMDTGAVTLHTTYDDTGCITKSNKKVCNFDFKARGIIPVQEILSQSLNVGATFLADAMGHDNFGSYVHAYGLGEKTGIDMPDEVTGNISAIDKGSDIDYASASFGQSIAVSPIEMIRALSVLANDGVLPNPHVVTAVKYDNGISRAVSPGLGHQVLKPETASLVTNMLVQVFDKSLLKGALKMDHYSIAAKTGTAQIGIPGGGGYYTDRYLHSFFGYFPAQEPKYIVFLFTVEPHGQEYASATLAHPFYDIAKYLINYYQIPPDR